MTMTRPPKVGIGIFYFIMIKNNRIKGEIWVGLEGIPFAVRAEDIREENDGKVTFIRLVGSHRKERISTRKEHVLYVSETLETS
jgi:hypothetical protein